MGNALLTKTRLGCGRGKNSRNSYTYCRPDLDTNWQVVADIVGSGSTSTVASRALGTGTAAISVQFLASTDSEEASKTAARDLANFHHLPVVSL